ncbi:MAG: N-acetyltransferase [Bacteroidetes bacterium HGW-Bacteroidetes-1]|jgi:ribosomal-protein-serine acetyltransferase|nr:MAG: N-acetyltransferase [Bacteroidetes bacterium HGW-Bacteroidetes-1]
MQNTKNIISIKVSDKILLRELCLSDVHNIFQTIHSQRDYLGKWLPFVAFTQVEEDTRKFVQSIVNATPSKKDLVFVILYQDVFAGLIGFRDTDHVNLKTEIGYWLSEDLQKKGIVTEAVKAVCYYAFNGLNINRIMIRCATGNLPSKRIPQRLDFHYEGIEREGEILNDNQFVDLEVYSLLKSDWEKSINK